MDREKSESNIFDFRLFLHREFASRQGRNAKYSLRAFARDLDLPAPKLSQILKGTCGLSAERGEIVAKRLGLTPTEKRLFVCCLEANFSRNPAKRQRAKARLALQTAQVTLDLEQFRIIADWYHLAILETLKLKGPVQDVAMLARLLNIEPARAEEALARLEKLQLIEWSDDTQTYTATERNVETTTDIPSRDIREHHRQVLNKAATALDQVGVEERDFSSIFLAFSEDDMTEAKAMLNEFKDRFEHRFSRPGAGTRVYAFALQFFPITKKSIEAKASTNTPRRSE